jgi:hypothetical protein
VNPGKVKLEIGKRYVCGDGGITNPLVKSDDADYPFEDPESLNTYTPDGKYLIEGEEDPLDIISEYIPDSEPVPRRLIAAALTGILSNPNIHPGEVGDAYVATLTMFFAKAVFAEERGDECP